MPQKHVISNPCHTSVGCAINDGDATAMGSSGSPQAIEHRLLQPAGLRLRPSLAMHQIMQSWKPFSQPKEGSCRLETTRPVSLCCTRVNMTASQR